MSTPFELATAVEPLGDGRFSALCDVDWSAPRGPNGGYLAAIMIRVMTAELGDAEREARSITLHYLSPPVAGPMQIEVKVERSGRTLTTLSARLEQDGKCCLLALGAFAGQFSDKRPFVAQMPKVGAADQIEPIPVVEQMPPIAHQVVMRPALGALPFSGSDEAISGGWMRLNEPQRLDAAALALYCDAWLPAVFTRLTEPVGAPTVDLTIHFRDPHAALEIDPSESVLGMFRCSTAIEGFVEEDGEIWSADGRLLAHSRQLALLVEPK